MLELYHNDMSVCSQKVRLALWEKGLAVELHHFDLRRGDQFADTYLALNPNGVVPTVVHDGKPIVESTVINEYLDDAFPEPAVRPRDPRDRAQMRLWTKIPDEGLHVACAVLTIAIAFRWQYLALSGEELEDNLRRTPDPARRSASAWASTRVSNRRPRPPRCGSTTVSSPGWRRRWSTPPGSPARIIRSPMRA